ncbi:MAG: hypothetical protein ACXVB4_19325 [Pseudobdellovibrionaceae bacterium]
MKRHLSILMFSVFAISSFAQAQVRATTAERAQYMAEQLKSVESQMSYGDLDAVAYSLDRIERILLHYSSVSTTKLSCMSNGSSGVFEKFYIANLNTGKNLGGETTLEYCRQAVEKKKDGMVCVSNGSSGVFERFTIMDAQTEKQIGGGSSLDTCVDLIAQSNAGFVCVSNGSDGVFQRFNLYNRKTDQNIGGQTSKESCLASIPR